MVPLSQPLATLVLAQGESSSQAAYKRVEKGKGDAFSKVPGVDNYNAEYLPVGF